MWFSYSKSYSYHMVPMCVAETPLKSIDISPWHQANTAPPNISGDAEVPAVFQQAVLDAFPTHLQWTVNRM